MKLVCFFSQLAAAFGRQPKKLLRISNTTFVRMAELFSERLRKEWQTFHSRSCKRTTLAPRMWPGLFRIRLIYALLMQQPGGWGSIKIVMINIDKYGNTTS